MSNSRSHTGASHSLPSSGKEAAVHGIWTGTISFSLVAIPVQLVKLVDPGRVSFRLLHGKDYSPLSRTMFCPEEESPVLPEEIIRGYEISPGEYLPITDEELESVSPERSRTIEIVEFIDIKEVAPVYFDHPYYLIPLKGGEKSYRLLVEVMRRTNKAGLARFVLHEREYLVAVKSTEGALVLITLHYHEEILSAKDIAPKEGEVAAKEKSRIKEKIKKMLADFNPGKYADIRRNRIMNLLKKMEKEKALVEPPEAEEAAGEGPADLIAALEESMRKVRKGMRQVKKNR
ncbi:MAG: Ku protein [Thermodesulfobacteriota bacterium]